MQQLWKAGQRYWDCWQFKRQLADYFYYLSQLMQATQGQMTLRTVFAREAERYGLNNYRGRLAWHWLQRYEQCGGDLALTWSQVLPSIDKLVIQMGQARGDQALAVAFNLLAQQHQQRVLLRSHLLTALWPVFIALLLISSMMALIPLFTVPELLATFVVVPEELYGAKTKWLITFSQFVSSYGVVVLCTGVAVGAGIAFSLTRFVGRARPLLELFEPWRSYKILQSTYFFALLSLLLNDQVAQLRLGQAVQLIGQSSNKWLVWQVQKIQERMVRGEVGAKGFATGLLNPSSQWFFEDVEQSQGIGRALSVMHERLYQHFQKQILLKAQIWRWLLLLGCVGGMLAIGGWHYLVIDEMRRALLMFYAQ